MIGYGVIPYILTGIIMVPLLVVIFLVSRMLTKKYRDEQEQIKMLQKALNYDHKVEPNDTDKGFFDKLFKKYDDAMHGAEYINRDTPAKQFYRVLGILNLSIIAVGFIFTQNVILGILIAAFVDTVIYMRANSKINKVSKLLDEQVPSFISTLKSNVQANQTPEKAIIAAVDNTSEPLYSEIKIVKQLAETGSFEGAMTSLRRKTNNPTLKFLCSCVQLSSEVGSNLETQLDVIESIIVKRKELNRKLDKAISENKPLLYVSFSIIPGVFIFTYMIEDTARNFWFHSLISWAEFGFVVVIMVAAAVLANRFIGAVRKMQ